MAWTTPGAGIDLARPHAPDHAAMLEAFRDQLMIVLLKRLGGTVDIPVAEVDGTGQDLVLMSVVDGVFHFKVKKKD